MVGLFFKLTCLFWQINVASLWWLIVGLR